MVRFLTSLCFFFLKLCPQLFTAISCIYLCNVFGGESLSESSICLCDDDNDIEMALACSHAFLPAITSSSMRAAVDTNLSHFTITYDEVRNVSETAATDEALDIIRSILK